jgi:hypothetical protein
MHVVIIAGIGALVGAMLFGPIGAAAGAAGGAFAAEKMGGRK